MLYRLIDCQTLPLHPEHVQLGFFSLGAYRILPEHGPGQARRPRMRSSHSKSYLGRWLRASQEGNTPVYPSGAQIYKFLERVML